MTEWTREMHARAEGYMRKAFGRDDELAGIALVLAWWYWRTRTEEVPLKVFLWQGCKAAKRGRDLPGLKSHFRDAFDRSQECAAMEGLRDRRPGPDRRAMAREAAAILGEGWTHQERRLANLVEDGITRTTDLAEAMGVSLGRVSQLRRRMADQAK